MCFSLGIKGCVLKLYEHGFARSERFNGRWSVQKRQPHNRTNSHAVNKRPVEPVIRRW